ncbi:MAG: Hpt domain-containing protein, partial [Gammaproteobacteria bacterium]|nr:Hpt domain-containing protein [Gammaproteobacteria bacterium]
MNSLAKNNIRHPLIWVKPELDVTIKAIHSLLKTYTENFDDDSALKEINKNLHLLKGSLEILEFYGVALLVESMQSAVKTIQFESTVKKEDVFESLLQATLSLEAYIDKLHKEQKDLPLSLLPVMNDIRASINEPLLSESALFLPNLSIVPKTPGDIPKDYDDTCLADSARSLRPYYQAALLTWYRDPTDQLSMQQMKLVARNLESSSLTPRNRQIWWIMGGLYEALLEQGLKPNISLKLLLAQADRVLKSLSQENNEHFEKSPPVDLLKNALYYISQSTSNGERIKTLKHVYNLNDVIPSDRDIATYRKDLKSPNSDALQAIAKELKKSLDQVKAIIDNFARNTPEETEKLIQTIIPLKHIADTMSLLSLGKEKQLLQSLINKITDIVAEPTPPGKEPMLEIASSMLHIESALKNIGSLRRKQNASQQNSQPIDDLISGDNMISMKKGKLPEAEYRLLVIKTAEEAQNNIVEVKNNVLAYLSSDEKQKGSIKHIPDLLSEIRGSMIILNNKYLPEILNALIEYVTEEFLTNKKPKTDEEYDAFAEALVSIEYYLEAIAEERNPSTPILDITCENLKKLGYSVDLPKQIDRLLPPLEAVVTHISVAPDRLKPNITAKSYAKSSQKLIENNIFTFSTDEPDPEVKEIFIEEAYDELSKMEKCIKSLKLNPADVDSLSLMRRIYHTLKGSGKIAGANDVSEIASIIDDYLARVLCNSVSIDQQGVTLLADAHQLLQQLVDSFQNKTPIKNQSQDFKDRISSLLTPKPVANTEHSAHEDHTEIEKTQASGLIKASQEIEKILNDDLNIIGQSIKHNENDFLQIESIERFIAERTHSNIIAPVSDELSHAISQLKISAEKTENREFIQTIELLSKYINNISKKQAPINQETLDILTEFCNTTKELLTELPAIENDEGKGASPEEQSVTAEDELTNSLLESEILETLSINQSDITPADEQESETETSAEINTETNTELTANTIISGQASQTDTTDNVNYLEHEDNIDLIDIFMEEALELIEKGNEIISDTNSVDETFLASFQRLLHTMKGSARMAGVTSVGNIAHMLESVFEAIITKKIQLPDNLISLTQETLDAINDMIEDIQAGADLRTHNELLLKLENAEKFDNARITKTESNQDEAVEDVIDEATNESTNEST